MRYSYDLVNSNKVAFLVICEQSVAITASFFNVDGFTLNMFFCCK